MRSKLKFVFFLLLFGLSLAFFTFSQKQRLSFIPRASYQPANLVVDTKKFQGPLPHNWRAIAQGGEEPGVRMLENVALSASALKPRYIRLDHIYDFYNVVSRDGNGQLQFYWDQLDATICDIYHMGAKPFLVLGYMPNVISADGSLIAPPKDWSEWSLVVQKTIERYSGQETRLCGGVSGEWFKDIYYEVWNEPDLEIFGKWSIYGGKDYRALYYYTAKGAQAAQNVQRYLIGGPITTRPYRNWFLGLINYVRANALPMNFISWHHYSTDTNDFRTELKNIQSWLADPALRYYQQLPRIISEWGYDSNPNPIADTNVGAAHTVATIRYLIDENVEMAFAFEMKDGPTPKWGIFTHDGEPKPRFYALKLLNVLGHHRLVVSGEGSYVTAIASLLPGNRVSMVIVNYDQANSHLESVPITLTNLANGRYRIIQNDLTNQQLEQEFEVTNGSLKKDIIMNPNSVISLEVTSIR